MVRMVPLVVLLGCACVFDRSGLVAADAQVPLIDQPTLDSQDGEAGPDLLDSGTDGEVLLCSDWAPKPLHFDPCKVELPSGGLTLATPGDWTYDTTDGSLSDPQGDLVASPLSSLVGTPPTRVISVDSFEVQAGVTLRIVGDHPLVVAAWSTATVGGTLDVASYRDDKTPGAGSNNPTTCVSHAPQAGQTKNGMGGGGGGAGFGDDGGDGSAGNSGNALGGSKGTKVSVPFTIRGGCDGAKGGDNGGRGGFGGGALQVTARTALTVLATGELLAGGAGGGGGTVGQRGGGGGGSGGHLGLEAPTITLDANAVLAANGGGGGEGSNAALAGQPGTDGAAAAEVAQGGFGTGGAGNGGAGGWRDKTAGTPGGPNAAEGGGGGGGSVGLVLVWSAQFKDLGATASPKITKP